MVSHFFKSTLAFSFFKSFYLVKELVGCTETDLLRRPGLGRKRLAEIKDWLNKRGLSLKDEQTRKKSLTPEQTETLKNIFDKTKSFCDSGLTEAMFYHLYPRAIRDTLNVLGYEWPEWLWPIAERYED